MLNLCPYCRQTDKVATRGSDSTGRYLYYCNRCQKLFPYEPNHVAWQGADAVLEDFRRDVQEILQTEDPERASVLRAALHEHALEIIATHGTGPIGGLARICLSSDPTYLASIAPKRTS